MIPLELNQGLWTLGSVLREVFPRDREKPVQAYYRLPSSKVAAKMVSGA